MSLRYRIGYLEYFLVEALKNEKISLPDGEIFRESDGKIKLVRDLNGEEGCPSLTYLRTYPKRYTGLTGKEKGSVLERKVLDTLFIHFGPRGVRYPLNIAKKDYNDLIPLMGINLYTLSAEQLRKVEKERGAMNEKVGIKERIGMIFSDGEYLEIGSENNCLEEGPYVKYTSENSLYIIREAIKSSGYERLEDLRLFLNPREDRHCKDRLKRPLPMLPRFFKIIIPYWSKNVSEKVAIHNT